MKRTSIRRTRSAGTFRRRVGTHTGCAPERRRGPRDHGAPPPRLQGDAHQGRAAHGACEPGAGAGSTSVLSNSELVLDALRQRTTASRLGLAASAASGEMGDAVRLPPHRFPRNLRAQGRITDHRPPAPNFLRRVFTPLPRRRSARRQKGVRHSNRALGVTFGSRNNRRKPSPRSSGGAAWASAGRKNALGPSCASSGTPPSRVCLPRSSVRRNRPPRDRPGRHRRRWSGPPSRPPGRRDLGDPAARTPRPRPLPPAYTARGAGPPAGNIVPVESGSPGSPPRDLGSFLDVAIELGRLFSTMFSRFPRNPSR